MRASFCKFSTARCNLLSTNLVLKKDFEEWVVGFCLENADDED